MSPAVLQAIVLILTGVKELLPVLMPLIQQLGGTRPGGQAPLELLHLGQQIHAAGLDLEAELKRQGLLPQQSTPPPTPPQAHAE